jgi:Protein of unknown function (DUF1592)/Protein of unknown function (DUF1588)/Protein of unknown function (DUF1587)/Protein of unknown function (DUF1585)/Protein of unknown function (DUF1595)/Planctomycete cytochrome C
MNNLGRSPAWIATMLLLPARLLLSALCCTAALAADPTHATRDPELPIRSFLQTHCTECHGGKEPDAGLSLEKLAARFDDPATATHWMHVHDQLVAGEMPPSSVKEKRPTAAETGPVISWLRTRLHAASFARQRSDGRAAIRRLNRIEYENTLSDLLGVPVHVRDLLPEDGAVSGFDTVSGGLDISATHLVRYQQAAERALDAALPAAPPQLLKETVSGKQWFERVHPNIRSFAGRSYTCEGEVGVLYQYDVHTDTDIRSQQRPMAPGLYRVRLTAAARNTQGRPLPLKLVWEDARPDSRLGHLIGYRDVPAGAATTIELVVDVPVERTKHSNILLQAFTLPPVPRNKEQDQTPPDPARSPALEIHRYEIEGPLSGWPSPAYRTLFGELPCEPRSYAEARAAGKPAAKDDWTTWNRDRFAKDPLVPATSDARADAERLIRAFLPRAFRRPVDAGVADYYVAFAHQRLTRGIAFAETMRATYRAILCSPHFLFLPSKPGALDDHALASRLSYFLWSSQPDAALRAVADAGRLRQANVLREQVERMLADDKATRFIERFTDQWLGVQNALAMKPDDVYIEYDDHLGAALAPETRLFVREMLERDLSITALIDSDWTFVNQRLAKHYGIPDVHGYEFRKVALLPEYQRGGVLTHASILKATTNGTYTSPIKRGVWLLEQIVGQPPRPPPPDVAAVQPDIRGATTLREQIEKHRALPACAGCHAHIDPPGFALESYDVLGGFRTRYRTPGPGQGVKGYLETLTNYHDLKKVWFVAQVDPAAVTDRGEAFADLPAYKRILLQDPDQLARTVARKLMTYATGADVQFADRQVLDALVASTKSKSHGLRTIVHALVQSRVFLEQ